VQILTVAFDRERTDALSRALRDAGHQVLGATGRSSSRTLARVARPEVVLVPLGGPGVDARSWVGDLLEGIPVVPLAEGADPLDAVRAAAAGPPGRSLAVPPEAPGAPTPVAVASSHEAATAATLPPAPAPDLAGKLAEVRFGDYHAVLEVDAKASAYVIRERFKTLSALYRPTGWPGPLRAEDVPALDEIRRGVEDAFSVLGDPELRARYERALLRSKRTTSGAAPSREWR
jgi:hypothetical protein